ncbi:hypothetical protein RHMOL_Rhmol09G0070600 [Rhododendron molle]|uniref:Uncharacterized protein n=1 Tax=Rhododendron molle TaxID=49168 RepID=A0ACC0MAJ7_RHOML|nr:hypothetical protein RHMOL_Rhmol09G0070600 [Rhododendron molle]
MTYTDELRTTITGIDFECSRRSSPLLPPPYTDEVHRATPGGTGGVKTIGNYASKNPTKIKNKEYRNTTLNGAMQEGEHKALPQLENPVPLGVWSVLPRRDGSDA